MVSCLPCRVTNESREEVAVSLKNVFVLGRLTYLCHHLALHRDQVEDAALAVVAA